MLDFFRHHRHLPFLVLWKKLRGSKLQSPGMYALPLSSFIFMFSISMTPASATTATQYAIETLSRPPLSSDGDDPAFVRRVGSPAASASGLSHNSARGHPTAASMARRECLISASRMVTSCSMFSPAKPNGSNPTSPARVPSRSFGFVAKGSAFDMFSSDSPNIDSCTDCVF